MNFDEGTSAFGLPGACPAHGDGYMRECTMCGTEFCAKCLPASKVCEDCAEAILDGEEKEDFDEDLAEAGLLDGEKDEEREGEDALSEEDEDERA